MFATLHIWIMHNTTAVIGILYQRLLPRLLRLIDNLNMQYYKICSTSPIYHLP